MSGLIVFSVYALALGSVFVYLQQPYSRDWWLKITTLAPYCVYYFGPFQSQKEANSNVAGYRRDLEEENAQVIQVQLHQCFPPAQLTFCPEDV